MALNYKTSRSKNRRISIRSRQRFHSKIKGSVKLKEEGGMNWP